MGMVSTPDMMAAIGGTPTPAPIPTPAKTPHQVDPNSTLGKMDFSNISLGNFNIDTGYGLESVITEDVTEKMQNIDYSSISNIKSFEDH